jgi:hypothetical protein
VRSNRTKASCYCAHCRHVYNFVGRAFVGGTIERAIIDVSGEPFTDLAAEVRAAFVRD